MSCTISGGINFDDYKKTLTVFHSPHDDMGDPMFWSTMPWHTKFTYQVFYHETQKYILCLN